MIKVYSLDLLKDEKFDSDIFSSKGKKLYSKGDIITPDILLKLYFREIYKEETHGEKVNSFGEVEKHLTKELEMIRAEAPMDIEIFEKNSEDVINLEFDEIQAKRLANLGAKFGRYISYAEKELDYIEKSLYYSHIGRKKLTTEDEKSDDFRKKVAIASYDVILNELKLPIEVAETAKSSANKYKTNQFSLSDSIIPLYDVASLIIFYDSLLNMGKPKDEVLDKMLQLGSKRFNIYILHKFIKMMKDSDDE